MTAQRNVLLAFKEFERQWLQHNTKGLGAYVGVPWGRHPVWGADPRSDGYRENREKWHRNLGEMLTHHATFNVGSNGRGGRRLTLSLSHGDVTRLMPLQMVAGGRIKPNPHHTRLFTFETGDDASLSLLKAGRLYSDPQEGLLFDRIDAAISFRRYVPRHGGGRKVDPEKQEQLQVAQLYWAEHLEKLEFQVDRRPHDCKVAMERAGGVDWSGAYRGQTSHRLASV